MRPVAESDDRGAAGVVVDRIRTPVSEESVVEGCRTAEPGTSATGSF